MKNSDKVIVEQRQKLPELLIKSAQATVKDYAE
jgi:hypothetical protein